MSVVVALGSLLGATLVVGPVVAGLVPAAEAAPYSNALALDGSDDYTTTPDSTSLDLGDADGEDFTVEAVVFVDDATKVDGENDIVWHKGTALATRLLGKVVFHDATPDLLFFDTSVGQLYAEVNLTDGWHHLAWVFDNRPHPNQDRLSIFLDGSEVAWTEAVAMTGFPNTGNAFQVGGNFGINAWDDWVDEVRVSSTVHYAGSYPVPGAPFTNDGNTRALWHFNAAPGATSFVDSSGNGNTLTGVNGAHTDQYGAPPPSLQLAATGYPIAENAGTASIVVTRTGAAGAPVSVDYATGPGTATPADYTTTSGTLSFAAWETSKTISVPIVNDAAAEGPESFTLTLSDPTGGASVGTPGTATISIGVSDQRPDVWVSLSATSGFVGNNVYNTTGAGQSKTATVRRGHGRDFYVRIYNDGTVPLTLTIRGTRPPAGAWATYWLGSTNVTSAVTGTGRKLTGLARAGYRLLRVRIAVTRTAKIGALLGVRLTASWTGDRVVKDAVNATAKVTR
jgi:hypothetical protein